MELYDLIFEKIQEKYAYGELTLEQANEVNELAYDRYVLEDGINSTLADIRAEQGNVNKVYIDAISKASTEYKKEFKRVKNMSKTANKSEVLNAIKELETKLSDLDKIIDDTPEGLASETLTRCAGIINTTFKVAGIAALAGFVSFAILGQYTANLIDDSDANLKKIFVGPSGTVGAVSSAKTAAKVTLIGSLIALPFLKNKYGSVNQYKIAAKKIIATEQKNCKKLEDNVRKAK